MDLAGREDFLVVATGAMGRGVVRKRTSGATAERTAMSEV
jgi:hypothetical protein